MLLDTYRRFPLRKKPGRTEYLRAILTQHEDGTLTVDKAGEQGSGILTSMSLANCLIVLNEHEGDIQIGDTVCVQVLKPI